MIASVGGTDDARAVSGGGPIDLETGKIIQRGRASETRQVTSERERTKVIQLGSRGMTSTSMCM